MTLIELGRNLLETKPLQLLNGILERLWSIEDLWMFIVAVPFFAAMFSWPIGYWIISRSDETVRRWFIDQLILVGVGLVFGGGFFVATALS